MANAANLIPITARSAEERFAICSAGGKASAAARRKAKAMREAAQILLASPLTEAEDAETAALLRQMGLEPDQQSAILLQVIRKAREGDIRSIQFVRELAGQDGKGESSGMVEDLRRMSVEELERMLEM